jgi:hypothetical protein
MTKKTAKKKQPYVLYKAAVDNLPPMLGKRYLISCYMKNKSQVKALTRFVKVNKFKSRSAAVEAIVEAYLKKEGFLK